jgi:hypothetical protein
MATFRNDQVKDFYAVGQRPPTVSWTFVKGDTAAFRVYTTDDNKEPLVIEDWDIKVEIKRPNVAGDLTQNSATLILTLFPIATNFDGDGEFTVSIASNESSLLRTGDIFDIELRDADRVWTVAQGSLIVLEDVTN